MEEIEEEREYSKLEWFFYMILIPALFATLLGGVLLTFLGVDVLGNVLKWANSIPYVEKIIPGEGDETDPEVRATKQLEEMQAKQTAAQQQIAALQEEAEKKDATIQALEQQVENLKKQLEEKQATKEERQRQYQDLAKMYTNMSAKNAAAIIENLSLEEAVAVLTTMKPQQRAEILAKMDPKQAADISILLKDTVVNEDEDIAALQERVQILTKALSQTRAEGAEGSTSGNFTDTFAQMPPADVAAVIRSLMQTNQQKALTLMKSLPDATRAQVLAAIVQEDKANDDNLAARISNALLRQ